MTELDFSSIGTVISYDGKTGRAIIGLSEIREGFEVRVDGMEMAQEGIDLVPGTIFKAVINTTRDARGIDFSAMEQPLRVR